MTIYLFHIPGGLPAPSNPRSDFRISHSWDIQCVEYLAARQENDGVWQIMPLQCECYDVISDNLASSVEGAKEKYLEQIEALKRAYNDRQAKIKAKAVEWPYEGYEEIKRWSSSDKLHPSMPGYEMAQWEPEEVRVKIRLPNGDIKSVPEDFLDPKQWAKAQL